MSFFYNAINLVGDSTVFDDVLGATKAEIDEVNTNLNNVSVQSSSKLYPVDSSITPGGRTFNSSDNPNTSITYPIGISPWYFIPYPYGIGVQNRAKIDVPGCSSIICSSANASLNQFSFDTNPTAPFDTFNGYDSTSKNAFIGRGAQNETLVPASITTVPGYSEWIAENVQNEPGALYGTNFTVLNNEAGEYRLNYSGVRLYFPTANTPRWMFLLVSSDNTEWIPVALTKYTGSGNEIFSWDISSSVAIRSRFWRIVVPNASNTSFDLNGVQLFYDTPVGSGNQNEQCSLLGTCLSYNYNPYPIIPLIEVCNEGTTITTDTTLTYRVPVTFRISNNKLPVFWVSEHNGSPIQVDILYDYPIYGGTSIYDGASLTYPRIVSSPRYDSGTLYTKDLNSPSCGLLKTQTMVLEEGKLIQIKVISVGGGTPTGKGLKVTFYSS